MESLGFGPIETNNDPYWTEGFGPSTPIPIFGPTKCQISARPSAITGDRWKSSRLASYVPSPLRWTSTRISSSPAVLDLCKHIELLPYKGPLAVGQNAACRVEVVLADGRSVAMTKTDFDNDDGADGLEQRIERKFLNLSAALPEARQKILLTRLKSIERQENVAQILVL
jgi:hypothetical protein